MEALKKGDLDLALTGQEGAVAARTLQSNTRSIGVCVAVADTDSLVSSGPVSLAQLKGRDFIGVERKRDARPKPMDCRTLSESGISPKVRASDGWDHPHLSQVASENAVTLVPNYFRDSTHPASGFWMSGSCGSLGLCGVMATRQSPGSDPYDGGSLQ